MVEAVPKEHVFTTRLATWKVCPHKSTISGMNGKRSSVPSASRVRKISFGDLTCTTSPGRSLGCARFIRVYRCKNQRIGEEASASIKGDLPAIPAIRRSFLYTLKRKPTGRHMVSRRTATFRM